MLKERDIPFSYRDYKKQPLNVAELRALVAKLPNGMADALATRSRPNRTLGLAVGDDPDTLLAHMAEHPTLLRRPIAVLGDRALVARPSERMLELVGD